MLQQTIARVRGIETESLMVVCNEHHRFLVAEQLLKSGIENSSIILEPEGRNTAPAICIAALEVIEKHGDGLMLVLPADHKINDVDAFEAAVRHSAALADSGNLVTFGIKPTNPNTGYGYILAGEQIDESALHVDRFVEKPNQKDAQRYLDEGTYYWNSGMFMLRASDYLNELAQHQPAILDACRQSYQQRTIDSDFVRIEASHFVTSPAISIDYAVMEKTAHAAMVPFSAGWSDVGSWSSLWEVGEKDMKGNVIRGDVHTSDVNNSLIYAENRMVAALGVSNHVVVETADAVLIADMNSTQDIKQVVETLNSNQREEALLHLKVARPWGSYACIDEEPRFKVKRIIVKPHASLSLQLHHQRAEHWVVVKGSALVTRGDENFVLNENESTYIPVETRHRLENPNDTPLEIIEVQSGNYLGEDDIVRFDDHYGRHNGN